MGFGKSFKKTVKSIGKAVSGIGKLAKKAISLTVEVTKGIVSGEYLFKVTGQIVKFVGQEVVDDVLGFDNLGEEISNVGSDIKQIGSVLGGDFHDASKELEAFQRQVQNKIDNYNAGVDELVDRMDDLIAFHEIFQMALSNRLDNYTKVYGAKISALIKEYEAMAARLKSEYDFVLGLTSSGFIQRIIGSIIMMIGGIMSDMTDVIEGKADSDTFTRVATSVLLIVTIITMWWNPMGWGATSVTIGIVLSSISAFMALDGMYSNGAATGAIMGTLDFIFNDLLNLDDFIGSDFDKFDKDHEDYKEMVMYTKLAIALAQVANAFSASIGSLSSGSGIANSGSLSPTNVTLFGESSTMSSFSGTAPDFFETATFSGSAATSGSSFLGITLDTYSDIYKAYSAATDVNDVVSANKQYNDLKNKLTLDRLKLEEAINSKISKNFMKSYKDTAYFLQDQQEYLDRYIYSMTSENMYVDPYGTTPVANVRFSPDKDTRMMSFGFEDVFNENMQAGSKNYFNNILYGA